MSEFAVTIETIAVEDHPNADRLEIGRAEGMDYQFIVPKGQFESGDSFAYIPEQAVLPDNLIQLMGLEGKLAGSEKNRVKAIRLRGVLSQGLALDLPTMRAYLGEDAWYKDLPVGDISTALGIHKYEPPIPQQLQGRVKSPYSGPTAPGAGFFRTYTEIENIKKVPDILLPGEPVMVTEKLHGSCTIVGIIDDTRVVSSKGIAKRGFVLEEDENNTYWRIARQCLLFERLSHIMAMMEIERALLFGEVLGVQDLTYGLNPGELDYRAFDLFVQDQGPNATGRFIDFAPFTWLCRTARIPTVPLLYEGQWDRAAIEPLASGPSTLAAHIREGVVIKPVIERRSPRGERVIAKWISPDYLTRKSGTEFE